MFVNFMDPAMLYRNAELQTNEASQGTSALGTPDPNALAAVHENAKAHMAENAAGQYEKDLQQGLNAATNVGMHMADISDEDRRAILASQTGVFDTSQQTQANKPKWWQAVLGGAAAAAPMI